MDVQGWFPLELTGLILQYKESLQQYSPAPQFESIGSLVFSLIYGPILISEEYFWKIALTIHTFFGIIMSVF